MSKFADWYERHWRAEGETKTNALYRFCLTADVSHRTVRSALAGKPLGMEVAAKVAGATGGEFSQVDLMLPNGEAA